MSQYMMELAWRYCSATTMSRAKSWTDVSGSRTSARSRLIRSPPTQYSRISHRWLVVSYLGRAGRWGARLRARAGAREQRCVGGCCGRAGCRRAAASRVRQRLQSPRPQGQRSPAPGRSPGVELEDVLVVQHVHRAHLGRGRVCVSGGQRELKPAPPPAAGPTRLRRRLPVPPRTPPPARCRLASLAAAYPIPLPPAPYRCPHPLALHTSCSTRPFCDFSTLLTA
jgi:hypothetical protein